MNETNIPSELIEEPLAKAVGVLWYECKSEGKTAESLNKFYNQLKALSIFIGNTTATHAGMVLMNHRVGILKMLNR